MPPPSLTPSHTAKEREREREREGGHTERLTDRDRDRERENARTPVGWRDPGTFCFECGRASHWGKGFNHRSMRKRLTWNEHFKCAHSLREKQTTLAALIIIKEIQYAVFRISKVQPPPLPSASLPPKHTIKLKRCSFDDLVNTVIRHDVVVGGGGGDVQQAIRS